MKALRILLSPVVYLVNFAAIGIIPIGPVCLFMGTFINIGHLFRVRKADPWERSNDREMMVIWFWLPWLAVKRWVKEGILYVE